MAQNDILKLVGDALKSGNCGRALNCMENYLVAWPEPHTAEKVAEVKEDYNRMVDYWQQGGQDPQREILYQQLLIRLYVIYANVAHYHRMKASPYQNSLYTRVRQGQRDWSLTTIRQQMESFVSNVTMLQLEPENKRKATSDALYREHQQWMNQLFEYVLTSRQWSDAVGAQFVQMMISPTIDAIDQQLIIAAVTLSLMNQFDMAKFRMLVQVYQQSQEDAVRQRALVGVVLGASDQYAKLYPEQRTLIEELTKEEQTCQELTELQIQLIYCLTAEQDRQTIERDIMPDLIKNSFKITQQDSDITEEDRLEEVLHPELSEQRMEQLESSVKRMVDMQQEGVDVFFHGFSHVKRYPFFYDISNWLVPFYLQHPDISQYLAKEDMRPLLERILDTHPFCNSDKYSMVLAFQDMIGLMPKNMVQIVKDSPAMAEAGGMVPEVSAAYLRRLYLMDLYRFFRLFSHRSELYNPFDTTTNEAGGCCFFSLQLFVGTPLERYKVQIVRQLKKHQMNGAANMLLESFSEEYRDLQYYLLTQNYGKALALDPDNERALFGFARQQYTYGFYRKALQNFEQLSAMHPEKTNYQLHVAVCLVQLEEYEEAMKQLYRLNYEQPDNDSVNRVLAWTLTCQGRLEQAHKLYEQLTGREQVVDEDLKNYGYCLWLQGDISQAKTVFLDYCKRQEDDSPLNPKFFDEAWLLKRGISPYEVKMMQALLLV